MMVMRLLNLSIQPQADAADALLLQSVMPHASGSMSKMAVLNALGGMARGEVVQVVEALVFLIYHCVNHFAHFVCLVNHAFHVQPVNPLPVHVNSQFHAMRLALLKLCLNWQSYLQAHPHSPVPIPALPWVQINNSASKTKTTCPF